MSTAENLTLHRYECTNDSYSLDLGEDVLLTLMLIPSGEFMMGSPDEDENADKSERPQHRVQLTQFLMGMTPVTQAQWRMVAGYAQADTDIKMDADPSRFKGDDRPVEQVNWYQANEFCQRLSKQTGKYFHLPSEAQWEYACRAETEAAYHFGPQLTAELAKYRSSDGTVSVGSYPPNRWGLYDMHGSVFEWCADHWHINYDDAPTDGSAWVEVGDSSSRVIRGGSWYDNPRGCRSAFRNRDTPGYASDGVGFRVVCSAPRALP
ncbi:MAG: formylglycine-generating enzyme family protein [Cyanobacteria bacterium P01_C01_bin.120]